MNKYNNQHLAVAVAVAVARTGYVTIDLARRVLHLAKQLAKRVAGRLAQSTRNVSRALLALCVERAAEITLAEIRNQD